MNVPSPQVYGYDLVCTSDLDPGAAECGGTVVLANALLRRAASPRGSLIYDPNYGYDLTQFVNEDYNPQTVSPGLIAAGLDNEFLKDPRVLRSQTTATIVGGTLTTSTTVTPSVGPTFPLVIGVGGVNAVPTILNVSPTVVTQDPSP